MVLLAVVITGCNEEFTDALLQGAGPVVTDAINALIASLLPAAG